MYSENDRISVILCNPRSWELILVVFIDTYTICILFAAILFVELHDYEW